MGITEQQLRKIIREEIDNVSNDDVKELIEAIEVIKQYMSQAEIQIDRMEGIADSLDNDLLFTEIDELRSKYSYLKNDLEDLKRDIRAGKFNGYYKPS